MKTDKLKLKLLAIMLVVAVGVSVSSCDVPSKRLRSPVASAVAEALMRRMIFFSCE